MLQKEAIRHFSSYICFIFVNKNGGGRHFETVVIRTSFNKTTRVFDSGWIEYFGGQCLYWVLFYFGKVNQWFFDYSNLRFSVLFPQL
jgi:hypothetical protein